MPKLTHLGDLERAVMDCLWSTSEPQTVRKVHETLSLQRDLAYTTVMTVFLFPVHFFFQYGDDFFTSHSTIHPDYTHNFPFSICDMRVNYYCTHSLSLLIVYMRKRKSLR